MGKSTRAPQTDDSLCMWLSMLERTPDDPGRFALVGWWLRGSPNNRATFLAACRARTDLSEPLRSLRTAIEGLPRTDIADETHAKEADVRTSTSWQWGVKAGIAAVALLVLGLALPAAFNASTHQHYSTGIGGYERVALADGSLIELNTASEVSVKLNGAQREVELIRGEANFKVAHDSTHPFVVKAAGTLVRAEGTEFAVRLYEPRRVGVLVTEGRVAISEESSHAHGTGTPEAHATAGQSAINVLGKIDVADVPPNELAARQAWRNGQLVFGGRPLSDIVAELNRYSYTQIVITDPTITGIRIGGMWKVAPKIDSFLTTLEKTTGVHATRGTTSTGSANVIYLRGAANTN